MRALAIVCLLAACVEPPPPVRDMAKPKVVEATPSPPPAPPLPAKAEVEIVGHIDPPAGQAGTVTIWVTDDECWKPGAKSFGSSTLNGKSYFVEVFVPQGTKLWVCAALVPPKGPIVWSGAAKGAPFIGQGQGEVEFGNIDVTLAKSKPVVAPPAR
jgi:hypothetical protein